jgi:DNA topoisomerase-3
VKLCIAEKPSVAKELAEILGASTRRDGYYEGNGYWISWTFGHLCTLKLPEDYHPDLKRWSLYTLPIIPQRFQIKVIDDTGIRKQFETIKRLVSECDEVINCGDAGQEGELIQRWVLTLAQNAKPLKRLWISSLTAEAIKEGFNSLQEGSKYDLLFFAGHARAVSDWLLGINATRLYTSKYSNGKGVLSIGRVQTPTLALIVRRHLDIVNFKPEPYWELKTLYRGVIFSATQGRFTAEADAADILQKIRESLFTITSFEKKKGTEAPPRLFDLTSLQVECNKKFGFTAEETLNYIQSLYEKKQVSYPRVDTTFLPNDIYPKVPGILKGLKPYEQFTEQLLASKIKKSKKVFDDSKVTDHHAIIPTGEFNPNLAFNEKKVFDLIIRRFIAAFYPDCIVSNTTVLGEAAQIPFKATGKQILEDGWRILFKKKDDEKDDDEPDKDDQLMPEFVEGESGPHEPGVQEKQTQPPKPYTEATLLRAMETAGKQVDDEELRDALKENGIGRPSTRANIIETLFKRKYIRRVRKNIEPTVTGIELIQTINNELLKSVELTGIWERKLRQIEKGDYKAEEFIGEMKEMVKSLVVEVLTERQNRSITIEAEEPEKKASDDDSEEGKKAKGKRAKKAKDDKPAELICPKCKKGKVLRGNSSYGCSAFKEGCTFRLAFDHYGKKLTDKQVETLIATGKTPKIKGFSVDGTKCDGILTLDEQGQVLLQRDEQKAEAKPAPVTELTCPTCQQGKILQGKSAFGCSRWKEGCTFKVTFDDITAKHPNREVNLTLLKEFLG